MLANIVSPPTGGILMDLKITALVGLRF